MTKFTNSINSSQYEYTVSGIDATVGAVIPFFTTLTGSLVFYPISAIVRLTNVAGIVTGNLNLSLGFNNPNYDNYIGITGYPLVNQNDFEVGGFYFSGTPGVPPATDFKVIITTPEATASPYTLAITIIGNYF